MASFGNDEDACPACGRHSTLVLAAPQPPLHLFMLGSDAEIEKWKERNRDNVFLCMACNWSDQEGIC